MAWNEPGGGKDPWGNRGGNDGGPPDLDEAFRKLKQRLSRLLSGRGGPQRKTGGDGGGGGLNERFAWILLGIGVLVWLGSGFYIVQPPERAVVTRFGDFREVVGPGPHWHLPWPIESVTIVDIARNRALSLDSQLMLTQDGKIVAVDLAVQYNVSDPTAFLFNVRRPEETLYDVIESAMRSIVGKNTMNYVITEGRGEVAELIRELSQRVLDSYGAGLNIQSVTLQSATAPEPVQEAYHDVNRAREDRRRFVNQALAYKNKIIPKARGEAAQRIARAKAYRTRVIQAARGEADRFLALLEEYEQAPKVTRKRLYLETMEDILGDTGKILIDRAGEGRNLIYVPLDKLIGKDPGGSESEEPERERAMQPMTGAAAADDGFNWGERPTRARESRR